MKLGARHVLLIVGLVVANARLFASTNTAEESRVQLSPQEHVWIAMHPVLRVGCLTTWAPFSYVREDGSLTGIDIDLLEIISQRTGLRFELIRQTSWENLVTNLDKVDMVCSTAQSPLREQIAEFTKEYSTSPDVIVEREGSETFGPAAVLRHKKLALPRRHNTTQTMAKRVPLSEVIFAATQDECFELVAKKKADATVVNLFVASQYLNSHPEINLDITGVISKSDQSLRMAVRRSLGSGLAVAILNKGLASVSQEELDDIVSKHLLFGLEAHRRAGLLQKRAKEVFIATVVAGVLLLSWNFFMRREILARRKVEAELREANESMHVFSHSLSHDLRAPLRGITGFAAALKEDYYKKLDSVGQDYLERIVTSGSRMDQLIEDVLTYSRTANSKWPMNTVELDPLVHQLIEGFPPDQRPCFQIVSKLPSVRGHATLLAQSLGNLLSNAVRFVPRERTPQVVIRATREDSTATVFVEDNGIGIEAKDQKRIFEIFERAAPAAYKGTGIGLSVVAKAAERMGGSVGVESEIGQGSRFWIRLPVASAQKSAREARQAHPFWGRLLNWRRA